MYVIKKIDEEIYLLSKQPVTMENTIVYKDIPEHGGFFNLGEVTQEELDKFNAEATDILVLIASTRENAGEVLDVRL